MSKTIEDIAEDIKQAGLIYKDLEKNRIPEIKDFLERIKVMGLGVTMPLLIWLQISEVVPEQLLRSIKALESYLVRQMLCSLPSQGLNKFFISLLEKLSNNMASQVDNIIIKHLAFHDDSNRVWPNDRILGDQLINKRMRGTLGRKKMVLEAVEMSLRTDRSEPLVETKKLSVEHIMPKDWVKNWPPPADAVNGVELRKEAIETIGNLTLTTNKLNASLSNGPWHEKQKKLNNHSSLFLNKQLLNGAPDVWDEAAIQERSKYLAKIIMEIWPSADKFTEPSE